MNRAMEVNGDWAFIAGLLEAGNANVFVNSQEKLFLSFFVDRGRGERLAEWIESLRGLDGSLLSLNPETGRGKASTRLRIRFVGSAAIKILNKTEERLKDPMLRKQVDLATKWWRTVQPRGQKLPSDKRAEREVLIREFEKLKQK